MNTLKQMLIDKALSKHKEIFPCAGYEKVEDCFSTIGDKLVFWYNAYKENCNGKSTHIETCPLKKVVGV